MADIELVIKIPEELISEIDDENYQSVISWFDTSLYCAIKDGTPLPKGHGNLIDADEIQFENTEFDTYGDYSRAFDAIDQADIIIEADKEGE